METQVRHIGIVCKDIEESIHFYCEILGCKISRRLNESGPFICSVLGAEGTHVETVKLSLPVGDTQIELLKFINPLIKNNSSLFSYGLTHIALTVGNIEKIYERVQNGHIPFISKPEISNNGGAKVFFCQDPNGVFLELVELLL